MKIKIPYLHLSSDWTYQKENEIETDDYAYFRIENRGSSPAEWWIEGYNKEWKTEENLTGHGCYLRDIVEFYHHNKNKIKQINVLHFHHSNNSLEVFFHAYQGYLKKVERSA